MRTRFLRGTRDQNNGLVLPEGELSIDEETKAVRLHDGVTPGGFEIIGQQAIKPGDTLVAGTENEGFYGSIPSSNFITGDALASAIGLSAGSSQHPNVDWLKFTLSGKVVYVPKLPFRYNLSWEDIYQAGAVYGTDDIGLYPSGTDRLQDAKVTINGYNYRVRLIRGFTADPTDHVSGSDLSSGYGSEWNRMFYRILAGPTPGTTEPTSDPNVSFGEWTIYGHGELGFNKYDVDLLGYYNWTLESTTTSGYRGNRGSGQDATMVHYATTTFTNINRGWRPLLELVQ